MDPSDKISRQIVTRFAPSPNGELHLGHVRSALIGYQIARRAGGRFLVRIEDIDITRTREAFVRSILDDLGWLGLSWERPELRQSQHFDVYREAAAKLQALGVLYPCFATRGEIAAAVAARQAAGFPWPNDPDGAPHYPGLYRPDHALQSSSRDVSIADLGRRLASGEPHALRLDMGKALALARVKRGGRPLVFIETGGEGGEQTVAAEPESWGDVVIVRKEFPASYHLAVVVDDARQGVTLVTRGQDLFAATGLHRLLQVLLDLPQPHYHHHRLLLDMDGRKLSKSLGAPSLKTMRAAGLTADEALRRAGIDHPHQVHSS